jgi:hypothetical protein
LFHFPRTPGTFVMGAAIGAAAVAGTIAASWAMQKIARRPAPARLATAFLLSFAAFEIALLPAVLMFGDPETFRPGIILKIMLTNAAWLVAIVVLNEVAAAWCRRWIGRIPRLIEPQIVR